MEFLKKYYADKDFGKIVMALWAIAVINALIMVLALGSVATNPMAMATGGSAAAALASLLGLIGILLYIYLGYVMGKAKGWGYGDVAKEAAIVAIVAAILGGIISLIGSIIFLGGLGALTGVFGLIVGIIMGAIFGAILAIIGKFISTLL